MPFVVLSSRHEFGSNAFSLSSEKFLFLISGTPKIPELWNIVSLFWHEILHLLPESITLKKSQATFVTTSDHKQIKMVSKLELKSIINSGLLNLIYNRGIISTLLIMATGHVFVKSCPTIPSLVAYCFKNNYLT